MAENETTEILLDAQTVARWLNLAPSTIYDQAARGIIPHIRLWQGARRTVIRFRKGDIEEFLRGRTQPSQVEG
jgi:predicted DNA-binding transcriptional regulator AlpA